MSIDANRAAQTVDQNFVAFDTAKQNDPAKADGDISMDDLRTVAENRDDRFSQKEVEAARFLLDSQAARSAFDVGTGRGSVDGTISREDIDGVLESIRDGSFAERLLDTANGRGGLDGNIGADDIDAALADRGVPQQVKNALLLLRQEHSGGGDALGDVIEGMSAEDLARAGELYASEEFKGLPSRQDQTLIAQTLRENNGNAAISTDLLQQIRDPSFQTLDSAGQTAKLEEFALLHSPEFRALPASDQQLLRDALATREPGDNGLPANIRSLIGSEGFQGLPVEEQTAVLSQVRNYPDSRSVANLERLAAKDWFQDFDLGDTQRAVKTIAFLSQNDAGDQTIISNTLDLFLADDAPYHFDFSETSAYGSVPSNQDDLFKINPNYIGADNNPVDTSQRSAEQGELRVIGHTFVHEVNHMRNWDRSLSLNSSYGFHEEYRAFYVGAQAQSGRTPTVADVIDRVAVFVNHDGGYDHLAALLDAGGQDAQEIVDYLNTILGRDDLTVDNARDEVNALVQAKKDAEDNGDPLPDSLTQPAGITTGPDGTNNLTNE